MLLSYQRLNYQLVSVVADTDRSENMQELNEDNGVSPQRETSYAAVLQTAIQGTVKLYSKPIFIKQSDLFGSKPTKQEWLSNVEYINI